MNYLLLSPYSLLPVASVLLHLTTTYSVLKVNLGGRPMFAATRTITNHSVTVFSKPPGKFTKSSNTTCQDGLTHIELYITLIQEHLYPVLYGRSGAPVPRTLCLPRRTTSLEPETSRSKEGGNQHRNPPTKQKTPNS